MNVTDVVPKVLVTTNAKSDTKKMSKNVKIFLFSILAVWFGGANGFVMDNQYLIVCNGLEHAGTGIKPEKRSTSFSLCYVGFHATRITRRKQKHHKNEHIDFFRPLNFGPKAALEYFFLRFFLFNQNIDYQSIFYMCMIVWNNKRGELLAF